ncbi:MAG: DUF2029 domain-containing protein [Acidobacteria bacterium]|nr:DUF2029 domain-containing protein [Acidobacteriota bacterium]MBI3426327.1 DUF2029 domain-containing protein [Acidobacteriota bacterium]
MLVILSLSTGLGIIVVVSSLTMPQVKDFRQEYVLAQAIRHGVYPYLPVPELGKLWLPGVDLSGYPHPTPHPVVVGWLCLPLTWFGFGAAAQLWLVFELCCLLLAVLLWQRLAHVTLDRQHVPLTICVLLGWPPLYGELWIGQLTLLLLVLFLTAWLALRHGWEKLGGALLGVLLLLKLMGWPLLLWLLWRRQRRPVWAAALTCLSAHALIGLVHGWALIWDYYTRVGPLVTAHYQTHEDNFSLWSIGPRLFSAAHQGKGFAAAPLLNAPLLAQALAVLLPLLFLAAALRWALRVKHFDLGFALLLAAGAVLNPVAWSFYLLLALPACDLLLRQLQAQRWPHGWTFATALTLGATLIPQPLYSRVALLFASGVDAAGRPVVPVLPGLVTFVPLAALVLLLVMLVKVESQLE